MKGTLTDDAVYVDAPARERFYDTRGYGNPDGDGLTLAPVEAAYLLHRDDLVSVDGMGFAELLVHENLVVAFVVYSDLRSRGYYLGVAKDKPYDVTVFSRGKGPGDNESAYRIRVVEERERIEAQSLLDGADTLAIVDEEGEISYYRISHPEFEGNDTYEPPTITGELVTNRVLVWEPPEGVHDEGFYFLAGQAQNPRLQSLEDVTSAVSEPAKCRALTNFRHLLLQPSPEPPIN